MLISRNKLIILILSAFLFACQSKNEIQDTMRTDSMLDYYRTQSEYTDPGKYIYLYNDIPDNVAEIVATVQQVLLPLDQLEKQHIQVPDHRIREEINFINVESILNCLNRMDDRSVVFKRTPENRVIAICAQSAMLTCSMLRHKNIPARCRGGFETRHSADKHHDHWICEYWNISEDRWIKIDPELNPFLRNEWNTRYNYLDLPENAFLTGSDTWKSCRAGEKNPDHFGIMGDQWIGGWDFVLNEMILDFMALNKVESLPWDDNRLTKKGYRRLKVKESALLDKAAELVSSGDESFHEIRSLYKNNKSLQK